MQVLVPQPGDQTCACCTESQPMDHQESTNEFLLSLFCEILLAKTL